MSEHIKLKKLQSLLKDMGGVAVAFSGGVDSTFLLNVAHQTLGDKTVAITAVSELYPARETEEARKFAADNEMEKLLQPDMREAIYSKIKQVGFTYVSLDLKGYRTGSMNETILKIT